MSRLAEQIEAFKQDFIPSVPEPALATMQQAIEALAASGQVEAALGPGDVAPDFELPELDGGSLRLSALLASGPVVISFYRGTWCPYCNLEMQALQQALPAITRAGATLVAIAPETAEQAGKTREKGNLGFPILQDRGNAVARGFGLVFTLPVALRKVYQDFGIDLAANQGNDRFELPMPATYIVGPGRRIAYAFVDADYTRRAEPAEIIETLEEMKR